MAEDERTPIDDLVDLFVYAPVGLLYEYDEVIPKLVRRGKSQVQLARVLGTMAVRGKGSTPVNPAGLVVEAMASMLVSRLTEIGESIGLAPPTGAPGSSSTAPAPGEDADETGDGETVVDEDAPLPIAAYDGLTAREIVGLLDELDTGQLARIRAHEESNRARKTVLGKLDRLGAGAPAPAQPLEGGPGVVGAA